MTSQPATSPTSGTSRRNLLLTGALGGAGALAAACAPAATPAAPAGPAGGAPAGAAKAAWEGEWDKVVEAAKKEGKVDLDWILGGAGGYQQCVDDFMKAFPGVTVGLANTQSGSLLIPKVIKEHQAGIYGVDMFFTQVHFGEEVKKAGALQPMKPLIFHPDALDDSKWADGFGAGWVDTEKSYGYGFGMNVGMVWWINTDLVKEGEIKSGKDLLDPKWRGRMILADPRSGYTSYTATVLRLNHGEDYLKQLLVDQKPAISRDNRIITESMVRGQHAIATGVPIQILEEFQKQGLGKNLKQIQIDDAASMSMSHQAWMTKGAPHPNAAKLFLNWLLTKAGQTAYSGSTRENSRRNDIPPGDAVTKPKPGVKYHWLGGNPAMSAEIDKTVEIGVKLTTQ